MTDDSILRAALLWARNHIDCSTDASLRDEVVETLDRVLAGREPTAADMQRFRKMYPRRKPARANPERIAP